MSSCVLTSFRSVIEIEQNPFRTAALLFHRTHTSGSSLMMMRWHAVYSLLNLSVPSSDLNPELLKPSQTNLRRLILSEITHKHPNSTRDVLHQRKHIWTNYKHTCWSIIQTNWLHIQPNWKLTFTEHHQTLRLIRWETWRRSHLSLRASQNRPAREKVKRLW